MLHILYTILSHSMLDRHTELVSSSTPTISSPHAPTGWSSPGETERSNQNRVLRKLSSVLRDKLTVREGLKTPPLMAAAAATAACPASRCLFFAPFEDGHPELVWLFVTPHVLFFSSSIRVFVRTSIFRPFAVPFFLFK